MRIGLFYKHYEATGGFPREFQKLASELAGLGEEVIIYTYVGEAPPPAYAGITVKRFPPPGKYSLALPHALTAAITEDAKQLDILEICGAFFIETIMVSRLARSLHIPYIVALLGQLAPKVITHRNRLLKLAFIHLLLRPALNRATGIHCFSKIEESWIRAFTDRPLILSSLGAFTEDIPETLVRHYWGKRLGFTNAEVVLLFLGRLDIYWKGLSELIEGFSLASKTDTNLRLVIVGPDVSKSHDALADQMTKLGISGIAHLLPPIYGPEKYDALASADLFMTLSHTDIIPRALREALATGTPALVSHESQAGDIVLDHNAGDRCTVDPHEISAGILRLTRDRHKLASLRPNARNAAFVELNWKTQAIRLRDGYRQLLN